MKGWQRYQLAMTVRIGLASLDGYDPAFRPSIQVLDCLGHELRPPECTEEADQQQGTVPGRGDFVGQRGDDPSQHVYIEGCGRVSASAVYTAYAPEDFSDQGVLGRVRMAESLVGVCNGREAAP